MAKLKHLSDLAALLPKDFISEISIPKALPPKGKLLVLLDNKGRKGKTMTAVTGYQGNPQVLEELGKKLKSHCGVGGSTKDNEILLQGDVRAKAAAYLISQGWAAVQK